MGPYIDPCFNVVDDAAVGIEVEGWFECTSLVTGVESLYLYRVEE